MLDVIRKKEYFDLLDSGVADRKYVTLKGIQDGWVAGQLLNTTGKTIIEVGGGNSRVMPMLNGNRRILIDKFEGVGNGPVLSANSSEIECIPAFIGEFDPRIPHADIVFSISVVEHVPHNKFGDFFKDLSRILNPGGMSIHAIDLPLGDVENCFSNERIASLVGAVGNAGLTFVDDPAISEGISFTTDMASNSDITNWEWSKISDASKNTVYAMQIVSLKLVVEKQ